MWRMEHTGDHTEALIGLLSQLLIFFGVSGLFVPLLQRIYVTPVLAYLLCGLIIGPYGVGLWTPDYPWLSMVTINDTHTVQLLGELGIIAMLFMIGMELSFQRLRELKVFVLGLGSLQIIVSTIVICAVAYVFDNDFSVALLVGASLALSSTAIVMQLLSEKRLGNREIGTLCFSILLMQDLAVVPIVVLASAFASESNGSVPMVLLESLVIAVVAIVCIYLAGRLLLRPLLTTLSVSKSPEWLMAFSLFVVVSCAAVTQLSGLSAALGAFLAGLLVAETDSRHAIETIIMPLKGILLGIFFLSVGMMIDLREVWNNPLLIGLSVIGIFCTKSAVIYPLCRLFAVPRGRAVKASVMLCQPGEFAFLIISLGMASNLVPREDAQFFLLMTAMAMFVAPLLFNAAPKLAKIADKHHLNAHEEDALLNVEREENAQVIIAGFGRIGLQLADILDHQNIPYKAFEHDEERAKLMEQEGYNVAYADASDADLWHGDTLGRARAVVIAVDNHEHADTILLSIRKEWPLLPVITRARDISNTGEFYSHGATYVIPELEETGRQFASALLTELDMEKEAVFDILEQERRADIA